MPLENNLDSAELLELLRFRDQALASAAEEAERKIRYALMKERLHQIETELPTLLRFRDQALASSVKEDVLRENMTRAYNAEKKVLEMGSDIDRLNTKHQSEIALIRSSRTWRIGHFILMPLRLLRALKR
jgi:hypothetical protein